MSFVCLFVYMCLCVRVLVCVCSNIRELFPSSHILYSILLWFIRYIPCRFIQCWYIRFISLFVVVEYFGVILHKHWITVPSKFRESICTRLLYMNVEYGIIVFVCFLVYSNRKTKKVRESSMQWDWRLFYDQILFMLVAKEFCR